MKPITVTLTSGALEELFECARDLLERTPRGASDATKRARLRLVLQLGKRLDAHGLSWAFVFNPPEWLDALLAEPAPPKPAKAPARKPTPKAKPARPRRKPDGVTINPTNAIAHELVGSGHRPFGRPRPFRSDLVQPGTPLQLTLDEAQADDP